MQDDALAVYSIWISAVDQPSYSQKKTAPTHAPYGKKGGMGVAIKRIECTDEEARNIIKAGFGTKLIGNVYVPDKK